MSDRGRVWTLNVATYRGISPGAQHSYGVVQAPETYQPYAVADGEEPFRVAVNGQKYGVYRVLDEAGAAQLNALNESMARPWGTDHKAGENTQQWDTDDEIEAAGLAVFRHVCDDPEAVLLLTSGFGAAGPCKPLAGPEDLVERLMRVWQLDESETSNDGHGNDVLRQATDWLDANHEACELVVGPSRESPMSTLDLIAWYGRHGFDEIRPGSKKMLPAMRREPR